MPGGSTASKASRRIGVLTSGGDCPGLNSVLRGIFCAADRRGWEVIGFRDGFEGMLAEGGDILQLLSLIHI